jgi:hypothetical protein
MPMALLPPPTQATRCIGQAADLRVEHLPAGLAADDALEVAHHRWVGVGPSALPEQVVGGAHIGHPIADGVVDGVLERLAAGFNPRTSAPSSRMRKTLGSWRAMSTVPM